MYQQTVTPQTKPRRKGGRRPKDETNDLQVLSEKDRIKRDKERQRNKEAAARHRQKISHTIEFLELKVKMAMDETLNLVQLLRTNLSSVYSNIYENEAIKIVGILKAELDDQHQQTQILDSPLPEFETWEDGKRRKNRGSARRTRQKKKVIPESLKNTIQLAINKFRFLVQLLKKNLPSTCSNIYENEVMKIVDKLKAEIDNNDNQNQQKQEIFPKNCNCYNSLIFSPQTTMPYSSNSNVENIGSELYYPQQQQQPQPQQMYLQDNGINNSALLLPSSNHNIPTYQNTSNFVGKLPYPQQQHEFPYSNTLSSSGYDSCTSPSFKNVMSSGPSDSPPNDSTHYTINNQAPFEKPTTLTSRPTWRQPPSGIPYDGKPYFDEFFQNNFPEDYEQQMSKYSPL
uniref:BZIP domain-containing protein n=1 Tax=Panagrolaimus davidi TaxID=227884 RepID=A0A914PUC2_9BILA